MKLHFSSITKPGEKLRNFIRIIDKHYPRTWRPAAFLGALLMLTSALLPLTDQLFQQQAYQLSASTIGLVGQTDATLTKQLTFDQQTQTYWYNKDQVDNNSLNPVEKMQQKAVGASEASNVKTYALEVPADMSKGVSYHDTNSQISFSLVPQFDGMRGRTSQDHLVFPLGGNNQAVYTLKNNGLKEDIIVPKVTSDTMQFDYTLKLPKSLEAKKLPDGSIGIFSADAMLFGDISYSTPEDQARVEKAREKAEKTNLVFAIPAPIIKAEHDTSIGDARAFFVLDGDNLSVHAENLYGIDVPITIDPSVVVTSTSDFQTAGNNESMIDYSTSGQITRGGITGGSVGAWAASSSLTNTKRNMGITTYNGFAYVVGGLSNIIGSQSEVQYAALNSDGTIGSWQPATSLPVGRMMVSAVAYGGNLYSVGGQTASGSTVFDTAYYAPINANGSIGAWTLTSSLPGSRSSGTAAAYNGFMYMWGGKSNGDNTGALASIVYAPINADGSLGAWVTGTSYATGRSSNQGTIYNGYVYNIGGINSSSVNQSLVEYAKIKSDGSVGAWTSVGTLPTTRRGGGTAVYNGYVYVIGGIGTGASFTNTTIYAPINADGSLGRWQTSSATLTSMRSSPGSFAYNGYVYTVGGQDDSSNYLNSTEYAKIDNPGINSEYTMSATYTTTRRGSTGVAYGGFLYIMGGDTGGVPASTTNRVIINSDGTLGTINTTTGIGARTFFGAFAYNGYMYIIGGCNVALTSCNGSGNLTTVSSAVITSTSGTLGAFTNRTALPVARHGHVAVVYNGYVYVIGGLSNGTYQSTILSAPLLASGSITTWTTVASTYNLTANRAGFGAAVNGSYVYISGGCSNGTLASCSSQTNDVRFAKFNETGGFSVNWAATSSFSGVRFAHGFAISNGYAYIAGGYGGSTTYNDTQYAQIAANGTIGAWNTGAVMTEARFAVNLVAYNNTLYLTGGQAGAAYFNTVLYAAANNGGLSASKAWTTDTADVSMMGADWNYGTSFAQDGFIYVLGGYTAGPPINRHSDTWYAPINDNGSIGTWVQTATMNANHYQHSMVVYNDFVYVMGGGSSLSIVNTVEYAPILKGGGLGTWVTSSNSLSGTAKVFSAAEAYNGYLYVLGGSVSSTYYTDVLFASVNADGSTGTWSSTTSLPIAKATTGAVAVNGYLYAIGGRNAASNLNDVVYAPINPNGTVGTWNSTSSLAYPANFIRAYAYNGYIFILQAVDGAIATGDRMSSTFINADGSLAAWQLSPDRGNIRNLGAAAFYNGTMYTLGGSSGGTNYTDIQYVPTQSIARTARYSKLIDLGSNKNISGLTFNGSVTRGQKNISYRSADSSGVFSSAGSFGDIVSGTCTTSLAGVRYLQIMVTLDDSTDHSIFADALNANAYMTDFTVNYVNGHPDASIRLRHGQTLQAGNLSPLDTCI